MTGQERSNSEGVNNVDSYNELTESIISADKKLQVAYPAARCQFDFDCVSGKRYKVGFGPLRVGDRLVWCSWANERFEENGKRYPIRRLPMRVKIDLVNSEVFYMLEEQMVIAVDRMLEGADLAKDKLDRFCEE